MSFAAIAAIPLMPIGDLIVISFVSPVFSVFLDRIILKRSLTFLAMSLCLFMVVGEILVVQPPFIFGGGSRENNQTNNISQNHLDQEETDKHGIFYYLGVLLAFYVALAGAVSNVLNAKCNQMNISTSQLMLVSGISSLLLSLVSSIFLPNRVVTNPLSLPLRAAILLPVSAAMTMIAYWTITLAVSVTRHPTLINMLRSTEIIISLVTESLWWHQLPGTLSLLGSLLVAVCVVCMAAHDKIVMAASTAWKMCRRRKN